MPRKFEAVVFDLDGTLIDSAPDLHAAANLLLAEEGRPEISLEAATRMVGDGVGKLVERAFAATGAPASPARLADLTKRFVTIYRDPARPHLTTVYPEVAETLAALRNEGLRLIVCTNKIEAAAVEIMAGLGLAGRLDAIVGSDTVSARKPDPAHVREALARVGVAPTDAALVGDGPNDIAAGRAAGLPVVLVTYGYGRLSPEPLEADALVDRFSQVPAALARLARERPPAAGGSGRS